MKTLDPEFQSHLDGDRLTLCTAVKLIRPDGFTVGLTDGVASVRIDGLACDPVTLVRGSDVETRGALSVNNMDVEMVFDSPDITRDDLLGGRWDFTEYTIYLVNYADTDGSGNNHNGIISRGWLGEVSARQLTATVEWRGMNQALQQRIGQVLSPDCRNDLGDARCGVDLVPWTVAGALTSVDTRAKFRDSNQISPPGVLQYGVLTFTTGAANEGQQMEVKRFATGGYYEMAQPFRKLPATGDGYSVYVGCDKSQAACQGFSNILNRQAEPFLIGPDDLAKFGRQ